MREQRVLQVGIICFGLGMFFNSLSAVTTTTTLTATIVASSCVGEIRTQNRTLQENSATGLVDFGVIHSKLRVAPVRQFSLLLFESLGGDVGCSAFEAYGRQYPVATLTFGDLGQTQLDEGGVIMRDENGNDAVIRALVTPLNTEAKFLQSDAAEYISVTNFSITYPIEFAVKGQFDFQASLVNLDKAKPGKFSGTLTVTVVYR